MVSDSFTGIMRFLKDAVIFFPQPRGVGMIIAILFYEKNEK